MLFVRSEEELAELAEAELRFAARKRLRASNREARQTPRVTHHETERGCPSLAVRWRFTAKDAHCGQRAGMDPQSM
jgi:hypothetical protein